MTEKKILLIHDAEKDRERRTKLQRLHARKTVNDSAVAAADIVPAAGDQMEDGTFYLGCFKSADGTEKDWFAAAEDAQDKNGGKVLLNFNAAAAYAKNAMVHGHADWMTPPGYCNMTEPDILNELFNQKAKIGGFDESGAIPEGWYWSSEDDLATRCQRFSDGYQDIAGESVAMSVRLVRAQPAGLLRHG